MPVNLHTKKQLVSRIVWVGVNRLRFDSDNLDELTYDKLVETAAARAESINKQLKYVPMPNGMAIFMG